MRLPFSINARLPIFIIQYSSLVVLPSLPPQLPHTPPRAIGQDVAA